MTPLDPTVAWHKFGPNTLLWARWWLENGAELPASCHHVITERLAPFISAVIQGGPELRAALLAVVPPIPPREPEPRARVLARGAAHAKESASGELDPQGSRPLQTSAPAALPPAPAAVAEYFRRKISTSSELSPADILSNESLWVLEICGLPESALDPAPIITREQAMRLDDTFSAKRFGPRGQYTKCAGCGDVFESLGLRLRSRCCKSSHAIQAKRCRECGASLPPGGRKTLKFCSDTCRQKAHRRDLAVTDLEGERLPGPDTRVSVTAVQADRGFQDPEKRNTHPARCAGCRREFQPTRKDTKFCSSACKQRAHRSGKLRPQNDRDARPFL